ncbi:DedA family protein [Microvirga massiliensis]|uniref:DedA family protein n=1 Tax=Microvirga massiliensis TaxID=1033741 RepID=UPI00062B891F|nr:DedA family protein [Microvirga massiliensis]
MIPVLHGELPDLVATYGYAAIAGIVALESMGIPLPGEAVLITASIYAGATHDLNPIGVIAAAASGAVVGDNIGFWLGRTVGDRLLPRYGHYVGLTDSRIKLGRYLFLRHGGKIVFLGRFVAFLRVLAAVLAGVNHMKWSHFVLYNIAGAVAWASLFGAGSYYLGEQAHRVLGPVGIVGAIAGTILIAAAAFFARRHEVRLLAEAEAAYPGRISEAADVAPSSNEPLQPRH